MSRGAAMDRLGLICPPAHASGEDAAAGRMRHLSQSDKCFTRFTKGLAGRAFRRSRRQSARAGP
ncbi:MAG: hypothetical protein AVDCRST_MAG75-1492 [uncultured Propionibacteriaceae bacterium]|uniref:Uncharacterized protein n=1 Tax=uncultured Propionibacteriaceae bacterium TaxID=257457 RepID=A0A6J4NLZ0_9ACTN|nr:MAG: hypothetical protein AVDCRST_MAG75-1492 [uncultured Propionibacteriaceae bacterium]